MTSQAAFKEQIEHYRRMTGAQRLAIAAELHEWACAVAREGIRQQHPGADEAEVERQLRWRIGLHHQFVCHHLYREEIRPRQT